MQGERQFGPYRLIRQIAVGGMAEIHLAKTRGIAGFEKYVAIKMIHPNFSSDENFIEMLIDEAKISVQLQHVNVAQTFDLGRVGDTYYITMEFVDGADLYKILRKASERDIQMPVDVAAFIAKEMANGLDYAHRKRDMSGMPLKIVHRDVSPQNVLISHSGEIKLVDFGIAKATMKARQTAVGVIKGKYYYMSPEQAWGDPVDHRTDIFSSGILLYEALVGQMLYLEEDLHRLLDMVRKANIAPPTTLRRDIPPQLERIVMNALKKQREDRYQTAGDLGTDLERFLHVYSPVFTPAKVADYFHRVLDDEPPPPAIEIVENHIQEPSMVTMRLDSRELMRERNDFADENSVIFRMSDLEAQASSQRAQAPATPRSPNKPTRELPPNIPGLLATGVLDNVEEATMVSGIPPDFSDSEVTHNMDSPRGFQSPSFPDGDGDFEPTMVGAQFSDIAAGQGETLLDDEGPTLQRDSDQIPAHVKNLISQQGGPPPAQPPPKRNIKLRKQRGPGNPALAASTPQPAVSELRSPKRSRKTPPGGQPAVGPSVLSSIVGQSNMPPVKRDNPMPGGPRTPGSGHHQAQRPGSGHHQAQPPGSGHHPVQHPGSGHHPVPQPGSGPHQAQQPGSGPHQVQQPGSGPYAQQPMPGAPQPGYNLPLNAPHTPPGMYPVGQQRPPDSFSPLPGGPPMTFTKQLQALELEEIPEQFKIERKQTRWLLRLILAVVCIAAGVGIGVLLFTRDEGPKDASLYLNSIPQGASVTVGGKPLPGVTPMRWDDAEPGARYEFTFKRDGYQAKTMDYLVREDGGELQLMAALDRETVTLAVKSTPPGAMIVLDGKEKGRTPTTLKGLSAPKAKVLELKLKGYKPYKETLNWSKEKLIRRDINLERTKKR